VGLALSVGVGAFSRGSVWFFADFGILDDPGRPSSHWLRHSAVAAAAETMAGATSGT
jgi:hypothetical protein